MKSRNIWPYKILQNMNLNLIKNELHPNNWSLSWLNLGCLQRKSKVATVWFNETLSRSELEAYLPFTSGTSQHEDDLIYYCKIGLSSTLTSYIFVKGVPLNLTIGINIHRVNWLADQIKVWTTSLIIRSIASMPRLHRSCCSNIWTKRSFMTTSRYVWDLDAFFPLINEVID